MQNVRKIGFGGGCHWCTEAVFMALNGVVKVEQGFIAAKSSLHDFSEAVIVHFDENKIGLKALMEIHLNTHKSTKNLSIRTKYRSTIHYFDGNDELHITKLMLKLQKDFADPLITSVLEFGEFKLSEERFQNYYFSDINKPFCKTHISPKIILLKVKFLRYLAATMSNYDA